MLYRRVHPVNRIIQFFGTCNLEDFKLMMFVLKFRNTQLLEQNYTVSYESNPSSSLHYVGLDKRDSLLKLVYALPRCALPLCPTMTTLHN